ncbi:MAG: hypothetical protein WC091_26040 [Sulfuricellaceae bacterium]
MKFKLIPLSALALLLSAPAFSAGSITASSISSAVAALNFSTTCSGGGTRVSTGSWDATSGALSLSSTTTACVGYGGEIHDGSRTMSGTLLLNGASSYTVDVTAQESYTVTRDGATTIQHTCSLARKGTFDFSTDRFTGTVSRNNCTDTGEVWDHQHGIESLLRDSQVIDVPPAPFGVMPQPGAHGGGHPGRK